MMNLGMVLGLGIGLGLGLRGWMYCGLAEKGTVARMGSMKLLGKFLARRWCLKVESVCLKLVGSELVLRYQMASPLTSPRFPLG